MGSTDPRDDVLLAALVRRAWLSPAQVEQFRASFQGPGGTMGRALVGVGAISPQQLESVLLELSGPQGIGGQRPPDQPLQPSWAGTTPGSALFPGPPAGAGSQAPGSGAAGAGPPGSGAGFSSARTDPLNGAGRAPGKGGAPVIPGVTILSELGRGGMGAVYRGSVDETGRSVAVKVLLAVNEARVKRFEREAQAMERLKHPHVVELVATGLDAGGLPYLAMDFVIGGDLAELQEKGIGLQQALDVVAKVTRAIDYAHGEGILHRDLKPANILIDAAGEPRVTDFGLAKILDRETQLTRTNAVLGTPFYMSPEQVRGEAVDEKTDVYALGVLLYELLTKEFPCHGENRIELYESIQHGRPTPPAEHVPAIPEVVSELILWALEKDPNLRPSGLELGDALSDLAAGKRPRLLPPSLRNPGRRLAMKIAGALVGLLLLAAGAYGVNSYLAAQEEARLGAAALESLRKASRAARSARARGDAEELAKEVSAHRALAEILEGLPPLVTDEGQELSAASRKRRPVALEELIELFLEAGRSEEAVPLARELAALLPEAQADMVLVNVLSRDDASASESYAAITRVRSRGPRGEDSKVLAEALLRLARPRQAAEALADSAGFDSPGFRVLRARAWRLAGEPERAAEDLKGARADEDPLALVVERARVEGDLGRPAEALEALERVRGSNDARWHEARGALAEQLGRPGAALEAYALAAKFGSRRGRAAQLLFQEGLRVEGLARLRLDSPSERLDGALARWVGGGPDEALREVLEGTIGAVEGFAVSPDLGAAAAVWLALLEASAGPAGQARALGVLEKASAWTGPGARHQASAGLVRAWLLASLGKEAEAREALPKGPAAGGARAALELELGLGSPEQPEQAEGVPLGAAWRALQTLEEACAKGASPAEQAKLSVPLHVALVLAGPRPKPGAEPAPIAVPLASAALPGARQLLAARLYAEARALGPLLLRKETQAAALAKTLVLLGRVVALTPKHVLARLDLARLGQGKVGPLAEEFPYFAEVRRVQIRQSVTPLRGQAREDALLALHPAFQALALSPSVRVGDLLDGARVARLKGKPELAWKMLQGPLQETHRTREVYLEAVDLARELGRPELAKLEEALAEIHQAFRTYKKLYAQADVGEGDSLKVDSAPALKRIYRDLPLSPHYYDTLAESQFGEGAWALANLTGGRYLVATKGMHSGGLSTWLYAFGWSKEAPQNLVFEFGAEEAARDRFDPAPHLGRAIFLAARATLSRGEDPEDVWRALRYTRLALELKPDCLGALDLTYFLTVSGRIEAEGRRYLALARALNPPSAFLTFHEGRAAALRGDWRRTLELYSSIKLATSSRRLLKEEPSFEKIQGRKEWADFVAEQQKR